jgi:hypothetical protein
VQAKLIQTRLKRPLRHRATQWKRVLLWHSDSPHPVVSLGYTGFRTWKK